MHPYRQEKPYIMLSDVNVKSLVKRVEKKLGEGYETLTKIKKVEFDYISSSPKFNRKDKRKKETGYHYVYKIAMRKVREEVVC